MIPQRLFVLIFAVCLFVACEKSEKDVANFSKEITQYLINQDSLSLYNKQMNGEISGRFGLLDNLTTEDTPQSPEDFIQISKENYDKKKEQQLKWYGNLTYQFKDSFDSNIKSYEVENIKLEEEKEVQDMLSTYLKKKNSIRLYSIRLKIITESGSKYIFKPGLVIVLDNKMYYDTRGYTLEKEPKN
ncbi:MAG: hypothetical protein LBE34_16745 [Flavobacteriaceae bacterium]|jgi:hypothetical protein|nr:hypothetical protein [Flavobacteriaceae bacterium]